MKVNQEVRAFAKQQNAGVERFVAAAGKALDAEAGMEAMSEVFKEKGGELYLPTE